jgi:IS30 family transposase
VCPHLGFDEDLDGYASEVVAAGVGAVGVVVVQVAFEVVAQGGVAGDEVAGERPPPALVEDCLLDRRMMRRPRGANKYGSKTVGQLRDLVSIRERPAEAEDRAVPDRWQGDLIRGTHASAVGTPVERSSRLVLLLKLEAVDAETVAAALRHHILKLPEQLRRSLTWDQGKELARRAQFTIDTGVEVDFCDPKSPWQRGSNEKQQRAAAPIPAQTHGPAAYSQAALDAIAAEHNGRPRKTLELMTPSEKFARSVALTARTGWLELGV